MLPQLTPPSATAAAAIVTAAIAGTVAITKKLLPRKETPNPDHITRAEFHQGMDALRDKIDARFLNLSEKIENLAASIHDRLSRNRTSQTAEPEATSTGSASSNAWNKYNPSTNRP